MSMTDSQEAAYRKTIVDPHPLDPEVAAARMREVKRIFDGLGITFWLGSGTCLGAIREGRFIPWDDETDTASIIGLHGLTMADFERGTAAFREHGFIARVAEGPRHFSCALVKDGLRTDWTVHKLIDGQAYEFPGIPLPMHVYDNLREIEFVGERFLVPDPPEDYLLAKYGPEWRTPKGPGFEADVVANIPDGSMLTRRARLLWRLSGGRLPRSAVRIRVYDREGELVSGAQVAVAGVGRARTNARGEARFPLIGVSYYAVTVEYPGHRELLYEEVLEPGAGYSYRPGPVVTKEEHYKQGVRALALVRDEAP